MANIRKYLSTVEKIENPLEGIFKVSFSANKKYKYEPGQFLHLALDNYDGIGQWPESRCFSMQSNAEEELVTITFAVKGKFTSRMAKELEQGKEVWLKMPYGDIFQKAYDKENCVFIAGGTGITPFLSLFTHKSFNEYTKPKIYLGFRSKEYNIYENELREICNNSYSSCNSNKLVQISVFYEDIDGMLKIEDIYSENGNKTYFISGPPIMIKNFNNFLIDNGINEEKIITDDWE